jgi:hypothetical protein
MFNKFILKIITHFLVFTDSENVIILCMIKLQVIHISKFKYFMVNMSYKCVFRKMNEFEFNAYDEDYYNSK